jgi:hypothetical protein
MAETTYERPVSHPSFFRTLLEYIINDPADWKAVKAQQQSQKITVEDHCNLHTSLVENRKNQDRR